MSTRTDQIFTALLALIFAGVAVNALSFPARARFIPLAIALPGLVLCLWEIAALNARRRKEASGAVAKKAPVETFFSKRFLANIFALPALLLAMIYLFGFIAAVPAFILGYMKIRSKEGWTLSVAAAAFMLAAVYVGFSRILEVPLFEGQLVSLMDRLW